MAKNLEYAIHVVFNKSIISKTFFITLKFLYNDESLSLKNQYFKCNYSCYTLKLKLIQIIYILKNVPLDKIQSHFILIDDGSKNKLGGEIDFRTTLDKFISEQKVNPDDKKSCKWFLCTLWTTNSLSMYICCTLEYSYVSIYSN